MKTIAEDHHAANTNSILNSWIVFQFLLISLGCYLLLGGNALPWPCSSFPDPWPECYPLIIHHTDTALFAVILGIGILLVVLTMNLAEPPADSIAWYILLLLPVLLFVARLRPSPLTEMRFPLIDVNEDLGGPSFFVMPVSLIAAWLALRPNALREKLRAWTIIGLLAFLFLTVFFLVRMGNRPYQITVSSFVEHQGLLRTGPLLMIAGGILLLGAELMTFSQPRKQAAAPERATAATAAKLPKVNKIGFWSALLACASPILSLAISLLVMYSPLGFGYDAGMQYLISAITAGLGLLLALSFLVVMASVYHYSLSEKKIWSRTGLAFALVYLLWYVLTTLIFSFVLHVFPQSYERLMASFPLLHRYGGLGFLSSALRSAALLFILPVFRRGRVELAVRWCIISLGVLIVVSAAGYLSTRARVPMISVLANSIGEWIVFPVAMVLIAVVFGRVDRGRIASY